MKFLPCKHIHKISRPSKAPDSSTFADLRIDCIKQCVNMSKLALVISSSGEQKQYQINTEQFPMCFLIDY